MSKERKINNRQYFKALGPGLVTGASDNDPSGIATSSQSGAQFGYNQLWTVLFLFPLMTAIQEACARIGAVKGKGIAAVYKQNYKKEFLYPITFLLFIANTINIGADIGGMAEAVRLIIPINFTLLIIAISAIVICAHIFLKYAAYANILKYTCLFLLAYPLTLCFVQAEWLDILKSTLIPHIEFNAKFLLLIVALFGTTISPYMFFWEPSQEAEEDHKKGRVNSAGYVRMDKNYIKKLRFDNTFGMLVSQICTWSVIVVSGAVLHTHGITNISTAADAAKGLEPFVQWFAFSGFLAKFIFACGILGLGFLAIPILAGSSAYAISETYAWKAGINLKIRSAYGFYGTFIAGIMVGDLINYIGVKPMQALVYAAVINGLVAVPLILMIGIIAKDKKIMGTYSSSYLSNVLIIVTFLFSIFAIIAMLASYYIK